MVTAIMAAAVASMGCPRPRSFAQEAAGFSSKSPFGSFLSRRVLFLVKSFVWPSLLFFF